MVVDSLSLSLLVSIDDCLKRRRTSKMIDGMYNQLERKLFMECFVIGVGATKERKTTS